MAIKRDISALPTPAQTRTEGIAPDPEPTFLRPYFDAVRQRDAEEGERPHAVAGTRFRHSMAHSCARQVAYHALGVPASDPMDLTGMIVTGNGTVKHDEVQAVLVGSGAQVEVGCRIEGFDGSGNADGLHVVERDGLRTRICWEHKNVGGFAFKKAVGERGQAEGPKQAHIVQGALNAKALDADELVITYMTWEAISVNLAAAKGFTEEGRIAAQWTFPREVWEPIADAEVARVSGILELLDAGTLPARRFPDEELPKGHVVTDPSKGLWQLLDDEGMVLNAGTFWACGYCRWQTLCTSTAAGRQPISEVEVVLGLATEAA
jgi:hypothetical protein